MRPLARNSLTENSYARKAKIQAFGTDCTQSALAYSNRNYEWREHESEACLFHVQ